MTDQRKQNSVYTGIAGIVGVSSLSVVVLVGVFSPSQMSVTPWIVASLSIMGIALGYFSSKGAT